MKLFLVTVSAALLCSHAFAASSYLGLAQGTPLGGFSQHGTLHGGLIPSGNGASLVNHGLPLGHLPGPIYGSGGYLDYAYGTGARFGYPYEKARFLKYLYGNPLGLANPYGALRNVRVGGVNAAEDETSSTSGAGATNGADFDSLMFLDITTLFLPLVESSLMLELQANFRGPHTPLPASTGFHACFGPYPSLAGLGGLSPYIGPYAAGAGFGRFNTAFGQNIPSDALRYRSSLNMSSGNMNNQEAQEE
nr:uncharacterized protein LOC113822066 [Penaeus vannamei]